MHMYCDGHKSITSSEQFVDSYISAGGFDFSFWIMKSLFLSSFAFTPLTQRRPTWAEEAEPLGRSRWNLLLSWELLPAWSCSSWCEVWISPPMGGKRPRCLRRLSTSVYLQVLSLFPTGQKYRKGERKICIVFWKSTFDKWAGWIGAQDHLLLYTYKQTLMPRKQTIFF